MVILFLATPVWLTYIICTNPLFQEWVRYTPLLSTINTTSPGMTPYDERLIMAGTAVFGITALVWFFVVRWFVGQATDPQLEPDMHESRAARLRQIARSRKRGSFFTPDYRVEGWNQSQYAPKNRKNGQDMTVQAAGQASAAGGLVLLMVCVFQQQIIAVALTAGMVWSLVFLFGIRAIRRREWRYIMGLLYVPVHQRLDAAPAPEFEFEEPPDILPSVPYQEFEREIAYLINMMTGHRTEVVGGSGDKGVDIKVYNARNRLIGIVQCKRYARGKPLAPMFIREAYACKRLHLVNTVYLVTTATFSEESRLEAARLGVNLIDGDDLERIRFKVAPKPQYRSINGMWDEP